MPPANTGKERSNKKAVISTAQTKSGMRARVNPLARIFKIVVIKFIAPEIEDTPAKCRLNIAISTDGPECVVAPDRGGYTVHPVPTPPSTRLDKISNISAGGSNQKLKLFSLGNAMSTAPIIIGTNQLPKPPIKIGITIKNIITKACAVTKTL